MPRPEFVERPVLALTNPNRAWTVKELDRLREEWKAWLEEAKGWSISPDYDPQTCADSIKDGWENIRRHGVLREKTLTFIGNNFTGYGFLFSNWPKPPHETNQARLTEVIPDWMRRLDTLAATIEYARVPDGYWAERGKELVSAITKAAPEKAAEVAAGWLKNPMG